MQNQWVAKGKIGNRPCLTNTVTQEQCLSGFKGEIWEFKPGVYKSVEFRYSRTQGYYQVVRTFSTAELRTWIERLEIPLSPLRQLEFANDFSTPFQHKYIKE